ncbi:hypothetical protein [Streptomyces gilvifuscus]|uniref:hypothetical protein n=1 Tax=Streptomyces TaxID=1883 RepID=UPI002FEE4198
MLAQLFWWGSVLHDARRDRPGIKVMLVRGDHLWFPEPMTVLVTRRHVDYVRVTTTGCSAVS